MSEPDQLINQSFETRPIVRAMRRARQIQLGMLPRTPVVPGLDIHACYQACEEVGGDFYDLLSLSPWELGIVIGDVSGHGVDAALLMAAAKKSLQHNARGRTSPRETILMAAEDLVPDIPNQNFLSLFYGVLDLRTGLLTYSSAGHNAPLLYNPARKPAVRELKSEGTVVGPLLAEVLQQTLTEETVQLKMHDMLLFFTDGLPEAMGPGDAMFGDERILAILKSASGPRELIERLEHQVARFRGPVEPNDDLTIVAMRFDFASSAELSLEDVRPRRRSLTNLSAPTDSFIAQETPLAVLHDWIKQGDGVTTVTGVGGCGKTRLACAFGRESAARFPGGVWLIDVGEADTAFKVASAVARTLSVPLDPKISPVESIARVLETRRDMLLILDGFERAAQSAGESVGRWVNVSGSRLLVTSRVLLGIPYERELRLGSLDTPSVSAASEMSPEQLGACEAVRLFCDRVREERPDFTLDAHNSESVAAICAELEGLPLAIELAAARTKMMSLEQIRNQLKTHTDKMRVLTSSRRDTAARKRSMEDAIRWSFNLLQDWERAVFHQLCVFHGGFWLEAAEAVLDLSGHPSAPDKIGAVQSLLEKSLLTVEDTPYGARFRMYAPIRDFGRHQWHNELSTEFKQTMSRRFASYFADYAQSWADHYYSRDCLEVLDRLEMDRDNIWTAQDVAEAMGDGATAARLAVAMNQLLRIRGPAHEQIPRLEHALAVVGDAPALRVELLIGLTGAQLLQGAWDEAARTVESGIKLAAEHRLTVEGARLFRQRGQLHTLRGNYEAAMGDFSYAERVFTAAKDVPGLSTVASGKAKILRAQGQIREAVLVLTEGERLSRAAGDLPGLTLLLGNRALLAQDLGHDAESLKWSRQVEHLLTRIGDQRNIATMLNNRGTVLRRMGEMEEALEGYLKGEANTREMGRRADLPYFLENRAQVHLYLGDLDHAEECAAEGEEIARSLNMRDQLTGCLMVRAQVALRREKLDAALALFEEGRALVDAGAKGLRSQFLAGASVAQLKLNRTEEALANSRKALTEARKREDEESKFYALACCAKIEAEAGDRQIAARFVREAVSLARKHEFTEYSPQTAVMQAFDILSEPRKRQGRITRIKAAARRKTRIGASRRKAKP